MRIYSHFEVFRGTAALLYTNIAASHRWQTQTASFEEFRKKNNHVVFLGETAASTVLGRSYTHAQTYVTNSIHSSKNNSTLQPWPLRSTLRLPSMVSTLHSWHSHTTFCMTEKRYSPFFALHSIQHRIYYTLYR